MKRLARLFAALMLLALALQACNLPSGAATPPQETPASDKPAPVSLDQALTLAVQTLSAAATPTSAPTSAPILPTETVAAGPSLSVSTETNCRTGPSMDYEILMLMKPGMTAPVVGKYGGSYWIIEYTGGGGAKCWLWGAYATVLGDTAGLPEGVPPPLPPPPTAVAEAPLPPKAVNTTCTSKNVSVKVGQILLIKFEWTVKITWKDQSENELGFLVYMDGTEIGNVVPGTTSYTYVFTVPGLVLEPHTYVFAVQAYNNYGTSAMKDVERTSCP